MVPLLLSCRNTKLDVQKDFRFLLLASQTGLISSITGRIKVTPSFPPSFTFEGPTRSRRALTSCERYAFSPPEVKRKYVFFFCCKQQDAVEAPKAPLTQTASRARPERSNAAAAVRVIANTRSRSGSVIKKKKHLTVEEHNRGLTFPRLQVGRRPPGGSSRRPRISISRRSDEVQAEASARPQEFNDLTVLRSI